MDDFNSKFTVIESDTENLPKALPLYGKDQNNLVPFWDWLEIRTDDYLPSVDTFHLRLHHIMTASQDMSEQGFNELCTALGRPIHTLDYINVPIRAFIELWAIARKHSREIELLREQGEIPEGETDEESE